MSDYRGELPKAFPPRYYAMKMLEGDRQVEEQLRGSSRYPEWAEIRDREPNASPKPWARMSRRFRQPEIRVHSGGAQGDLHPGETRRGLGHEADRHLRDAQAVGLPDLLFS